ncbi:MAG: hypothetical protein JWR86_901 [Enterovirga sp.]|nr:hypothetical protein [Enterovirga sp.]
MPRFFFHVRTGRGWQADPDGAECADIEAATREAVRKARVAVAPNSPAGLSTVQALDCSIAIADETGRLVLAVPCYEAAYVPGFDPLRRRGAGSPPSA